MFCSPTKPTILAQSQGKGAGFQIAMAPTQESRETVRQQANFYAMYFSICHGPDAGRAAVQNLQGIAQQYGYRSPLAKSVMVTFTSPEEVFSRPPAGAPWLKEKRLGVQPQQEARSSEPLPPGIIPEVPSRPASDATPWYEEPRRWIEKLKQF